MKLHTQIYGKGTKLVILHGFLGMGDNWKSLSKQYAKSGFEVHLPDMRNHGKSPHSEDFNYQIMAEDIYNYFQSHNVKDAVLIGHSMGGKIAMHFAANHPELLSHLIIVDIAPKYYEPHHDVILNSLKELKDKKLSSRQDAESILKKKIKSQGVRLFLLKNLKRNEDNLLSLKPNIDVFLNNKENIGETLPNHFSYKKPTLFVKGDQSDYIQSNDKELIDKHFEQNKIISIPNAGHWVHAENQADFLEKTLDFIR